MSINVSMGDSLKSNPLVLLQEKSALFNRAVNAVKDRYIGQEDVVNTVMTTILAGGNVLLEGPPGTGKTFLSKVISQVMDVKVNRIQFTSDMMPADIIGSYILDTADNGKRDLRFVKGPLFDTVGVHADELNRAPGKTQSATMQAMAERQITKPDGEVVNLEKGFFVIATQNAPDDNQGTYPLPDATLDRFLSCIHIPPQSRENERETLKKKINGLVDAPPSQVLSIKEFLECQEIASSIPVPDHVAEYASDLGRAIWDDKHPNGGELSYLKKTFNYEHDIYDNPVRGGQRIGESLVNIGRASAFLRGNTAVEIQDITPFVPSVLIHRMGPPKHNAEIAPRKALEKLAHDMVPGNF